LGETTKQLFVENRTRSEELNLQLQENEKLKLTKRRLEEENKRLLREVELQDSSSQELIVQQQQRKQQVRIPTWGFLISEDKESEAKIAVDGRRSCKSGNKSKLDYFKTQKALEDSQLDNEGLRQLLTIKTKEMRRIKKLARNILEQRTELEQFFLDALDEVKREVNKRKEEEKNHWYNKSLPY